jgi:hypothetical protein
MANQPNFSQGNNYETTEVLFCFKKEYLLTLDR